MSKEQGEEFKRQILAEVNQNSTGGISIQGISNCGAVSIAGFAHTTAFSGLAAAAGVSGPVGWALGNAVGTVWLAGSAAGCLSD
ncbi:hypothetical protein SAMN05421839_1145 [Halolactibacillus halophilus]|uniref:Bacteriocin class II with double-glycine leader peptide n=1 Tax=Halolactibacillus halophilus TaxID=306540 RepID=A0A1I5PCJ3_9BACI|nr:hypothetical protein [Halolactibacillus halophilus]GEM02965.1 hypothetical protein HHA03_24970 [Halolactibacillus halophilus]SFP31510.1 hypothetical protein SAMN05421839_1145 [Halolactibacillus halophilus]